MVSTAHVGAIGIAYPATATQEALWDGFFSQHYAGVARGLAKRIFANAGVVTRAAVVNPLIEDLTSWSTGRRMQRYLPEAMSLGKAAMADALDTSGVDPADIGMFVVCSCTGYATPGLDILLARDLGMAPSTQRLFVGHMGCYAAVPGLGVARNFVETSGRPAVLLCCELTSLHLQPASASTEQIVSHSLFADAAAAVVVTPEPGGLPIRDIASVTDTSASEYMTWDVTDHGFRMGLSPKVPDVLATHIELFVDGLLGRHGLTRDDVDGWAVHPGGPRILDVVGQRLELPQAALADSRRVLAEHGNCSSPTVLMILEEMRRLPVPPQRVLMLAFGPGLTLYAALLGGLD